MYGWFYKLFTARRFKSQAHLEFGLVRAFKETIRSRISEIIETTQSDYIKLAEHFNSYNTLNNSLQECALSKDEFDHVTKLSDPIVTPIQESRLRFNRKMYLLAFIVFFGLETMLFYLIAQNITGGMAKQIESLGRDYVGYATAFLFIASGMFALASALILDFGLSSVISFFKARKHYDSNFIDKSTYNTALLKFGFGMFMIVGAFIVLILMNWARSYAIDGNSSDSSSHNPVLVYALIAISIVIGIGFGLVKKEFAENSAMLSLASKWNKIRKQMTSTHEKMTVLAIKIFNNRSLIINKSHLLGVDLQELMEREYDERDLELLAEFRSELQNGKFHITNNNGTTSTFITPQDAYYYNNLTTNEELLHNQHFESHQRVHEIVEDVKRMMSDVNQLEQKRLSQLMTTNSTDYNDRMNNVNEMTNKEEEVAQTKLSTTNSEKINLNGSIPNNKLNGTLINH